MEYKEYFPLPKCLTIKQSPIHGLGLFAVEDIEQGVDLGKSHYLIEGDLIRTPLGGFINHSDTPNLILVRRKGSRFYHAVVSKNVKAGEELTGKYM